MPVRRRTFRYNRVYILAVGAGAPTLRFKRLGLSHKTNIRIPKIPQGLPCGIFTLSSDKLFNFCKPVLAGVKCDCGAED